MSNLQGSSLINTGQVERLVAQINNTTDCASLQLIVQEYTDQILDLASAIVQTQAEQLSKIIPILTLPSVNPVDIVKWLGKLVTAKAMPQLESYINQTLQLIQLLKAFNTLVDAIDGAGESLGRCSLDIENAILRNAQNKLNSFIAVGLTEIGGANALISQHVGTSYVAFDVSSPDAFVESVEQNRSTFRTQVDAFLNTPLDTTPIQIAGNGYTGSAGTNGFTGSGGTGFTGSAGAGFTGSAGTSGFTGSGGTGFTGSAGAGFTGSKGDTGTTGFVGSLGFTGSTGIGFTGSAGAGFTGSAGTSGFTGSGGTGFTGSAGAGFTGSTGFTGSGGTGFTGSGGTGFTGSAGAGFTGSTGFTGSGGTGFTGSAGTNGFTGSGGTGFTGSAGAGFTGSTGFTGSGGTGFTGSKGDPGSAGAMSVSSVSANTTLSSSVGAYLATGSITLTLPAASSNVGVVFYIKNVGVGPVVISGINNIDDDQNLILQYKNSAVTLISDGTGWNIF